jgi:DNA modification methylase
MKRLNNIMKKEEDKGHTGKIGKLEINKIHKMDCINFLKKLPSKSINLVLTDPPYGVGKSSWDDIAPLDWCEELPRVMKDDASLLIFCGKQNRFDVEKKLREVGLTFWQELIWIYGNGGILRKNSYNGHHEPILWFVKDPKKFHFDTKDKLWIDSWTVIDRARPQSNFKKDKKIHPTQKALAVVERFIDNHSREGDVVLDPFMGSGTTAVACKKLGRLFIGCDNKEEYVNMAEERIDLMLSNNNFKNG